MGPDVIGAAYDIAVRDLKSNYGSLGLYAGPTHHKDYWSRDSFIMTPGVCSLGDFGVVRRNLELFKTYQKSDGHIPLRIEEQSHILAQFGIVRRRRRLDVRYTSSAPWADVVADSCPLYIFAGCYYARESGDRQWFADNKESLLKAAEWVLAQKNNLGLVGEGCTASFADQTFRTGSVLYTNVWAWKALSDLSEMLGPEGEELMENASSLEGAIQKHLWLDDRGYFADWITRGGKRHEYFFSDGNILATIFGLATKEQGTRIYNYMDTEGMTEMPGRLCHPRMPLWMHALINTIYPFYKTCYSYGWIAPLVALGRAEIGQGDKAVRDLERFAEVIVRHGTVPEVMTPDGEIVKIAFYETEKQFGMAAANFIYVVGQLRANKVLTWRQATTS